MDESDKATHQEIMATEIAIGLARSSAGRLSTHEPSGRCFNCDEPLTEANRRWCDRDCLHDWMIRKDR